MKVWNSHSTDRRNCCGCRKKTGQYKVYDQSGIRIDIPLCDDCYPKVDVKSICDIALRQLNKEIKRQQETPA